MSTDALAETCLNYPLALDYSLSNNERISIRYTINRFNGLQELAKRSDGALALIKLYKGMPVDIKHVSISTRLKDNVSIFHLSYLELLLADDNFKNQLSISDCLDLQKIVQSKYEEKLKHRNTYSLYNIKKSLLLGSLLIDKVKSNSLSTDQKAKISEFAEHFENPDAFLIHVQKVHTIILACRECFHGMS